MTNVINLHPSAAQLPTRCQPAASPANDALSAVEARMKARSERLEALLDEGGGPVFYEQLLPNLLLVANALHESAALGDAMLQSAHRAASAAIAILDRAPAAGGQP